MIDNKKVVEIVERHINEDTGKINWVSAVDELNDLFGTEMSLEAFRSRYRNQKGTHTKQLDETVSKAETEYSTGEIVKKADEKKLLKTSINADGTYSSEILVNISSCTNRKPSEIMELHGYDPVAWKLVSHKFGVWNGQGKNGTHELFTSNVTVQPLINGLTTNIIEETFLKFKNIDRPKLYIEPYEHDEKNMLELNHSDVHLGKFSWWRETGQDYDLNIAKTLYRNSFDDLLSKARFKRYEKILLVIGNDWFHFDNKKSETTRGTLQDTDTRLPKMYEEGCILYIESIDKLLQYEPSAEIHVVLVNSNHDELLGYTCAYMLSMYYKNEERVRVDYEPKPRKYIQYGVGLVGLGHGSEEGKEIYGLMQIEAPKEWSETKVREMHLGHLHKEEVSEVKGVIYRRVSSITATDNWHNVEGYKGSHRKAQAFIWNYDNGMEYIINSYVHI